LLLLKSLTANLSRDFVSAAIQNSALEGVLLDLAVAVGAWDVLDHLSCLTMAELCMDYIAHMCHKNTRRQRRLKGLPPKTDFTSEIRALQKYLSGYDMGRVCSSAKFADEEAARRRDKHESLRVNWLAATWPISGAPVTGLPLSSTTPRVSFVLWLVRTRRLGALTCLGVGTMGRFP
jgi:hypothetical protein